MKKRAMSLILPYWERKEAADEALRALARHYRGVDLEVILVDDGSPTRYEAPTGLGDLSLTIFRLAGKAEPKCPVRPWNIGTRLSHGEIVFLSCVEILHTTPVLQQMADVIRDDPMGYVLAAAWCPERREWHCHSTERCDGAYPLPAGTGRAFLGGMHRNLFEAAGGWDEDYRDGAGYEDVDFVYRMQRAGAHFVIRDDLVVTHPKTGATIRWGAEKFSRNRALLEKKWPR